MTCSIALPWLGELNAFENHFFFETPECVLMCSHMVKVWIQISLPPPGAYTEPMEVGFQAVLAPGCSCELLTGRLVPCHLLATLCRLQGLTSLSSPRLRALWQTPPFCAAVAPTLGMKCLCQPRKMNLPHDDLYHALMD